jgi:hypothetical protein
MKRAADQFRHPSRIHDFGHPLGGFAEHLVVIHLLERFAA